MSMKLTRWLNHERLRNLRYRGQTVYFSPLLAGLLTAVLLATSAQLREIYLSIVEQPDWQRGLLGLGMLMLLSALIFVSSFMLSTWRADTLYPNHADIRFDRRLLRQRDGLAHLAALLPFAGILWGLWITHDRSAGLSLNYQAALGDLGIGPVKASGILATPQVDPLHAFHAGIIVAAGAVILHVALHAFRRSRRAHWCVLAAAGAVSLLAAFAPLAASAPQIIAVTRQLGPLASIAGVIAALYGLLMLLAYVTRLTGIPLIGILAAIGITFGFLNISRNVSPPVPQAQPAHPGGEQLKRQARLEAKSATDLESSFRDWLESRRDRELFRSNKRPYPVFVFAAQGGGLYAATAIGRAFAQLQRDCPLFMQHVFAVSAVSGGAVGSAVVHEAAAGQAQESDCDGKGSDLTDRISQVTLEDHLSPIVGTIIPDIIRKLSPFEISPDAVTRSKALEESIVESVYRDSPATGACKDPGRLCAPYAGHWNPGSVAPALVLNATWVENGHRVAFAPFGLEREGDLTLHSFSDFDKVLGTPAVSLIGAAVVSARFPGVLPAQVYGATVGGKAIRWNFVDGGYADASGAATALQIFEALNRMFEREPVLSDAVDLRLVLVTDSESDPDPAEIDGTGFSDTMAPISALLNIRALLSSRAVAQAVAHGEQLGDNRTDPADPKRRVMVVELDRKTFPLSIGWKMSRATYDIVGLLLGDPSLCRPASVRKDFTSRAAQSIAANSCITQNILRLLRPPATTSPNPALPSRTPPAP